ncbi:hypothetical protein BURK2_03051 [Burkholderiales bacterium]|nr:hypothetical protein BURK2_03051 [Burkholderiales bacterium]
MASYFIYNERFSEPIIQTQVINLLQDFNRAYPDRRFRLCVFQNAVFYVKEREVRERLVAAARSNGLDVRVYPLALPTRGWLSGRVGLWLHRTLFWAACLLLPRGTIFCRGYLATSLCTQVASRRGLHVVSDPRSLYARENVGVRWKEDDPIHRLWLQIEREMVLKAKEVIVVNSAMATYYTSLPGMRADKVTVIPIYSRAQPATDLAPQAERVRLIYVGSLSHSKWNDINAYRKFFAALKAVAHRIELVLVVKHGGSLTDELQRDLATMGISATVLVALPPDEVRTQMARADIGLVISDAWEDADARTGIKTIEYLSSSLAIWSTRHFADVARIISETDTGFVFQSSSPDEQEMSRALDDFTQRRAALRQNVMKLYESNYSSATILAEMRRVIVRADPALVPA